MIDTSGEINLQGKQDIICHVAKVKLLVMNDMNNSIATL